MLKAFLCAVAVLSPSLVWSQIFSENFDSYSINSTVPGWTYQTPKGWSVQQDAALDPTTPHHVFFNNSAGQQNIGIPIGSVVSLTAPGEYLELSFDYRYSAAPDSPGMQPFNFVRFGLYSSNGTSSIYADDIGYIGDISYWTENSTAPKSGDFSIRKEVNVYEDFTMGVLLDNESATNFGPPPTPETGDILTVKSEAKDSSHGEDGTTNHSAALRLMALPLGGYAQLYWDGNRVANALDLKPLSIFDTIYLEAPSDHNGFAIDNLSVTTGSISVFPTTATYDGGGGTEPTPGFPLESLEFTNTVYGRYILQGDRLFIGGTITNNSPKEQQIASGVQLIGNSTFSANTGGLIFSDVIDLNGFDVDIFASEGMTGGLAAPVSGSGSLTKSGNGTLNLGGDPYFSGALVVNSGSLVMSESVGSGIPSGQTGLEEAIGGPGADSAQEFVVNPQGTFVLDMIKDLENDAYSPKVSGQGTFVKKGANTVSVGGNFQFTGTRLLQGGVFAIEESPVASGTTVLDGGHLRVGTPSAPVELSLDGDLVWQNAESVIELVNNSSLKISGNLSDGGVAGSRTFDLKGIGQPAGTYTLATFGGGDFTDSSRFVADLGLSTTASGFTMQNGTLTFSFASAQFDDFTAEGSITANAGTNIIKNLDFKPNASLAIPVGGVVQLTNGNVSVGTGVSTIAGGTVRSEGDFQKIGAGVLQVSSNLVVPGTLNLDEGSLNVSGTLQAQKLVIKPGATFGGAGRIVVSEIQTAPNAPLAIPTGGLTLAGGKMPVASGTTVVTGGTLTAPGNFHKQGGGELDVESNLVVAGTLAIDNGLLSVNGLTMAGIIALNEEGTLGGNGTIIVPGGQMRIAGVLSPGNSPGTISIQANPVLTSTSTVLIEVESPTSFDRIAVDGSISLNGTLRIVPYGNATPFAYGQQYNFLTATGGITGAFDSIVAPETFRARFLNGGTTGTLLIAPDTYTRVAETPNQLEVAKALDRFIPATSGDRETVSIALDLQTAEQYPAAFEQIMPGFYESLGDILIEQTYTQTQLLTQRLGTVRLGAVGFQAIGLSQPIKYDKDGKSATDAKTASPIVESAIDTKWNSWVIANGEFSLSRGLAGVPTITTTPAGSSWEPTTASARTSRRVSSQATNTATRNTTAAAAHAATARSLASTAATRTRTATTPTRW